MFPHTSAISGRGNNGRHDIISTYTYNSGFLDILGGSVIASGPVMESVS